MTVCEHIPLHTTAAVSYSGKIAAIGKGTAADAAHTLRNCDFEQCITLAERLPSDARYTLSDLNALQIGTAEECVLTDGCYTCLDHNFFDQITAIAPRHNSVSCKFRTLVIAHSPLTADG